MDWGFLDHTSTGHKNKYLRDELLYAGGKKVCLDIDYYVLTKYYFKNKWQTAKLNYSCLVSFPVCIFHHYGTGPDPAMCVDYKYLSSRLELRPQTVHHHSDSYLGSLQVRKSVQKV